MDTGPQQPASSDLEPPQPAICGIEIVSVNVGRPTVLVRWRAVNAPHLVALVRAGAHVARGRPVEREELAA